MTSTDVDWDPQDLRGHLDPDDGGNGDDKDNTQVQNHHTDAKATLRSRYHEKAAARRRPGHHQVKARGFSLVVSPTDSQQEPQSQENTITVKISSSASATPASTSPTREQVSHSEASAISPKPGVGTGIVYDEFSGENSLTVVGSENSRGEWSSSERVGGLAKVDADEEASTPDTVGSNKKTVVLDRGTHAAATDRIHTPLNPIKPDKSADLPNPKSRREVEVTDMASEPGSESDKYFDFDRGGGALTIVEETDGNGQAAEEVSVPMANRTIDERALMPRDSFGEIDSSSGTTLPITSLFAGSGHDLEVGVNGESFMPAGSLLRSPEAARTPAREIGESRGVITTSEDNGNRLSAHSVAISEEDDIRRGKEPSPFETETKKSSSSTTIEKDQNTSDELPTTETHTSVIRDSQQDYNLASPKPQPTTPTGSVADSKRDRVTEQRRNTVQTPVETQSSRETRTPSTALALLPTSRSSGPSSSTHKKREAPIQTGKSTFLSPHRDADQDGGSQKHMLRPRGAWAAALRPQSVSPPPAPPLADIAAVRTPEEDLQEKAAERDPNLECMQPESGEATPSEPMKQDTEAQLQPSADNDDTAHDEGAPVEQRSGFNDNAARDEEAPAERRSVSMRPSPAQGWRHSYSTRGNNKRMDATVELGSNSGFDADVDSTDSTNTGGDMSMKRKKRVSFSGEMEEIKSLRKGPPPIAVAPSAAVDRGGKHKTVAGSRDKGDRWDSDDEEPARKNQFQTRREAQTQTPDDTALTPRRSLRIKGRQTPPSTSPSSRGHDSRQDVLAMESEVLRHGLDEELEAGEAEENGPVEVGGDDKGMGGDMGIDALDVPEEVVHDQAREDDGNEEEVSVELEKNNVSNEGLADDEHDNVEETKQRPKRGRGRQPKKKDAGCANDAIEMTRIESEPQPDRHLDDPQSPRQMDNDVTNDEGEHMVLEKEDLLNEEVDEGEEVKDTTKGKAVRGKRTSGGSSSAAKQKTPSQKSKTATTTSSSATKKGKQKSTSSVSLNKRKRPKVRGRDAGQDENVAEAGMEGIESGREEVADEGSAKKMKAEKETSSELAVAVQPRTRSAWRMCGLANIVKFQYGTGKIATQVITIDETTSTSLLTATVSPSRKVPPVKQDKEKKSQSTRKRKGRGVKSTLAAGTSASPAVSAKRGRSKRRIVESDEDDSSDHVVDQDDVEDEKGSDEEESTALLKKPSSKAGKKIHNDEQATSRSVRKSTRKKAKVDHDPHERPTRSSRSSSLSASDSHASPDPDLGFDLASDVAASPAADKEDHRSSSPEVRMTRNASYAAASAKSVSSPAYGVRTGGRALARRGGKRGGAAVSSPSAETAKRGGGTPASARGTRKGMVVSVDVESPSVPSPGVGRGGVRGRGSAVGIRRGGARGRGRSNGVVGAGNQARVKSNQYEDVEEEDENEEEEEEEYEEKEEERTDGEEDGEEDEEQHAYDEEDLGNGMERFEREVEEDEDELVSEAGSPLKWQTELGEDGDEEEEPRSARPTMSKSSTGQGVKSTTTRNTVSPSTRTTSAKMGQRHMGQRMQQPPAPSPLRFQASVSADPVTKLKQSGGPMRSPAGRRDGDQPQRPPQSSQQMKRRRMVVETSDDEEEEKMSDSAVHSAHGTNPAVDVAHKVNNSRAPLVTNTKTNTNTGKEGRASGKGKSTSVTSSPRTSDPSPPPPDLHQQQSQPASSSHASPSKLRLPTVPDAASLSTSANATAAEKQDKGLVKSGSSSRNESKAPRSRGLPRGRLKLPKRKGSIVPAQKGRRTGKMREESSDDGEYEERPRKSRARSRRKNRAESDSEIF